MRKLVADIANEMSLSAAQQGVEVPPVSLYKAISDALTEAEQVLNPVTIESMSAKQWASFLYTARRSRIPVRDALMVTLTEAMQTSAITLAKTLQTKNAKPTGKKATHLRLIK